MLAFRLCLALGRAHPDQLKDELTSAQWADWVAYNSIEPIGDERADLRSAIVAATLANCFRKAGSEPARPSQFMPYVSRVLEPPPLSLSKRLRLFFRSLPRAR